MESIISQIQISQLRKSKPVINLTKLDKISATRFFQKILYFKKLNRFPT